MSSVHACICSVKDTTYLTHNKGKSKTLNGAHLINHAALVAVETKQFSPLGYLFTCVNIQKFGFGAPGKCLHFDDTTPI